MKIRKVPLLWVSLGGAVVLVFAADYVLRSRANWLWRDDVKSQSDQPFMADRLVSDKVRGRVRVIELKGLARDAETDDHRAEYLLRAARIIGTINPTEQIALVRRVTVECGDSALAAEAWEFLIKARLKDKGTQPRPTEEVRALARLVRKKGLGLKKVDPVAFRRTIAALKKKQFLSLARELETAGEVED